MKRSRRFLSFLFAIACLFQVHGTAEGQDAKPKSLSPAQISNLEARAERGSSAVSEQMGLDQDQTELVRAALASKYQFNASRIDADLPHAERKEVWKEGGAMMVKALSDGFTQKEIRQINQIVRQVNSVGRLFNGTNLDGWEQVNGTATYEVVDGAIVGTTVAGSPNSFLATKKTYANFNLRFDVFLVDNSLNSGVQFRSAQHTEASLASANKKQPIGRVYGYQCEIEASAEGDLDPEKYGDAGYIYDEARRGWLVDDETRLAAKTRGAFKNGQWNRVRILAQGDHIQTFINGKKICDLKDDLSPSGFIALQVHGIGKKDEKWQVKWRNISIEELP